MRVEWLEAICKLYLSPRNIFKTSNDIIYVLKIYKFGEINEKIIFI